MRMADLKRGWDVVGNDGRRLGAVKSVGQSFVVASRGGLSSDLYVPASAIANVRDETVYLNLPKAAAEEMGWEQPPREDPPEAGPEDELHRHV